MALFPSPDEVADAQTRRGGWTRVQLSKWGVPWPPPRGWRSYLRRQWAREQAGQPPLPRPRGYSDPMVVRHLDG